MNFHVFCDSAHGDRTVGYRTVAKTHSIGLPVSRCAEGPSGRSRPLEMPRWRGVGRRTSRRLERCVYLGRMRGVKADQVPRRHAVGACVDLRAAYVEHVDFGRNAAA